MATPTKCIFCGAEEETAEPVENPVCDRPECREKAEQWGWSELLRRYIEAQQVEDEWMFRLKNGDPD